MYKKVTAANTCVSVVVWWMAVVVGFPCFVQVIIGWIDSALQCTFYGVRESNNAYASARMRVYVLRASSTYFINPKVSCNVTNDLNGPKLGLFERKNSTNSIFVTSPSLSVQRGSDHTVCITTIVSALILHRMVQLEGFMRQKNIYTFVGDCTARAVWYLPGPPCICILPQRSIIVCFTMSNETD